MKSKTIFSIVFKKNMKRKHQSINDALSRREKLLVRYYKKALGSPKKKTKKPKEEN